MNSEELERINRLVMLAESCLLPPLNADIGSEHISSSHFITFRQTLNKNLCFILDTLHKRPSLLHTSDGDQCQLLHSRLLLLICEQTALHAIYATEQQILMQSIERLRDTTELWTNKAIIAKTLNWYECRLTSKLWLRNMGAAHGFVSFCTICYDGSNLAAMFLLSVGTLMMEHYDHVYKELGLNIFTVLLKRSNLKELQGLNIHESIYRQCFHNAGNLKGVKLTKLVWQCIFDSLAMMECWPKLFPANWSKLDDIMEALLSRIAFESDFAVRLVLITVLTMVVELPLEREIKRNIDDSIATVWTPHENRNTNPLIYETSFRWTKKLLQIFISHLSEGLYKADEFKLNLRAVHKCYMTCLYKIPVSLIAPAMERFLSEFPPVLFAAVQRQRSDLGLLKDVCSMITTLQMHVQQNFDLCDEVKLKFNNRLATLDSVKTLLNQIN